MLIANITVLVVDARPYIGAAIGHALNSRLANKLVVTGDYAQAEKQTAQLLPDIIWLQMNIGHLDGIAKILRLKKLSQASRIIAIADEEDEQEAFAAIMAGALGYCSKEDIDTDEIVFNFQMLCRDQIVLSPALRERLMQRFRSTALGRHAQSRS